MHIFLPVSKLQKICDPYVNPPWLSVGRKITYEEITKAIKENNLDSRAWSDSKIKQSIRPRKIDHIKRITYLVVHGWEDPIQLDIGIPGMQCDVDWPILDGNHRFAAAIYKKDFFILASVSGDIDYGKKLFGIDITELG